MPNFSAAGTRAITAETALRLARYLVVLLASSDWALFQNDSYSGAYFMIVRSSEKKYSDFFGS